MKVKVKKKVLVMAIIILILIITAIIIYNIKQKSESELISVNISTSNIGVTTAEGANTWDTSKLSEIIVDTSMTDSDTGETITMYVPIPSGYTASKATSEDTVIEGLVIYEGTDAVNDSNVDDAKTTRNQYVWIPVAPEDVYWTDDNGKNWGVEYTFSNTGITANKYQTEPTIYIYQNTTMYNYLDGKMDAYGSNTETALELETELENQFNSMVNSIEKYGGFYISRYELRRWNCIKQKQ